MNYCIVANKLMANCCCVSNLVWICVVVRNANSRKAGGSGMIRETIVSLA